MPGESVQFSQTTHHRRSVAALILAVVVCAVIIVSYLASGGLQQVQAPVTRQTLQERLAATLSSSPDVPLSADQKSQAIAELRKSRATLSNAQKLDIINSLQEY